MFYPIEYDQPLFRPPAEAYSVIFQATLGCSWNKCAFCEMYSQKKFHVRPLEELKKDIQIMAKQMPDTKKFFLADGNAMILSYSKLMEILGEINNSFSKIQRVSSYSSAKDILSKSSEELKELRNAGLKLLYVGIESGDDDLLKAINKSETYNSTLDGLLKAHEAGIDTSVMILNGLGGKQYSKQHALNSAEIVNKTQPKFLSVLALNLPLGVERFKDKFNGEYIPLSQIELLEELKLFISNTELSGSIFRSDHISNYLVLKGNLSKDKDRFLDEIEGAISALEKSGRNSIPDSLLEM